MTANVIAAGALRAMTLTGWAALPEDEAGELVDGWLVEDETPDAIHEVIVTWLTFTLRTWLLGRAGVVLGSEARLAVSARRGRKADLAVYLPGSKKPAARGLIKTPPDIVVEVVSASPRDGRRDRVEKPDEYALFGVKWYWIVDPALRTLEIFELGPEGRHIRALAASEGKVEPVPGCEGLTLALDTMWQEVDDLESDE